MPKLSSRSKVAIRWTTNPADLGYGGVKSDWKNSTPTYRSPKNALNFRYDYIQKKLGQGVFCAIDYSIKGESISFEELENFVMYN